MKFEAQLSALLVLQIFKLKIVCDGHRLYGDDQLTEAVEKSVYLEVEMIYHSWTVESTNDWDTSTCHCKLLQKQKTKTQRNANDFPVESGNKTKFCNDTVTYIIGAILSERRIILLWKWGITTNPTNSL